MAVSKSVCCCDQYCCCAACGGLSSKGQNANGVHATEDQDHTLPFVIHAQTGKLDVVDCLAPSRAFTRGGQDTNSMSSLDVQLQQYGAVLCPAATRVCLTAVACCIARCTAATAMRLPTAGTRLPVPMRHLATHGYIHQRYATYSQTLTCSLDFCISYSGVWSKSQVKVF